MYLIVRFLLILAISSLFIGCEGKKSYDIGSDKAVSDMSTRIKSLEEDLSSLTTELGEVRAVLVDQDLDAELRKSIKKEILEGEKYKKEITQWLSYIKIQRKRRYNSLLSRKDQESLIKDAEIEVSTYFLQKKMKPIEKRWRNRYRTAIEL